MVRFIDAYVNTLDLVALEFTHAELKDTGTPPYDPGDLLRLYIYGYLNKTRASRLLEKTAKCNVEVMWLIRKMVPDHKTIAEFRRHNLMPLRKVYREFTVLCKKLTLFGGELVGIDGSKFSAINHTKRTYTKNQLAEELKAIDAKITEYLTLLDTENKKDESTLPVSTTVLKEMMLNLNTHKERLVDFQQLLEESGETQISQTDPDSRLMQTGQKGYDICYNVQIAVDSKHKLIVDFDVTSDYNDQNQLSSMAIKAKEVLGVEQLSVVADAGYYNETEIKVCHDDQITCYLPIPEKSQNKSKGLYTKNDFVYDKMQNKYHCPAGQVLTYRGTWQKGSGNRTVQGYEGVACGSCTMRQQCLRGKGNRRIYRWVHHEVIDALNERMEAHPEAMKERRAIVEHPFGTIKHWMNQGHFLMRGKEKVTAEMSLSALAYNMKRVINILGVTQLIKLMI